VVLVPLSKNDEMNELRRDRAHRMTELLSDIDELTLPTEPDGCYHIYYGYTIMVPEEWAGERRQKLMDWLMDERGVGTVVMNNTTWHQETLIAEMGYGPEDAPRSEIIGERLFCLSLHPLMTDEDLQYIADSMVEGVAVVAEG